MNPQIRRNITNHIKQVGWSAIGVMPTQDMPIVPFTYTIGLTQKKAPELIAFGIGSRQAHWLISAAIDQLDLLNIESDRFYTLTNPDMNICFKRLPLYETNKEYVVQASMYYGREIDVLQLVWPDKNSKFPWENECDEFVAEAQSQIIRLNSFN